MVLSCARYVLFYEKFNCHFPTRALQENVKINGNIITIETSGTNYY